MYEILDTINGPADIKRLDIKQLEQLCSELRRYMVECCAVNPGHLGSSLGAVELIVGFHYVFDSPDDSIVFDVGHQAYAHKILTGRREAFKDLRKADGISGFPQRDESPHDAFGVGHSSTSISAALGLAEAARIQGRDSKVVALIGDGALTGGLAFEGMNNAGASNADLLVILNDNNQSIDDNRGALHEHLLRVTTSRRYNSFKDKIWRTLGDRRVRHIIQRWLRSLKSWIVKRSGGDLFEAMGFRYFGPVNGNSIGEVVVALQKIKDIKGSRILHCITTKGKGYAPAEADPVVWHAPGRFDPATGRRILSAHAADRYQDVFGEVLCYLAEADPKVVGITPAMATGCGMNLLAERHPDRFFDVGIEEEHAVTFSAGLAAGGMRPFCNIYSAFSQRAYDQIIHDVALQRLPVVFCFDRAGLVGEDGATHHGVFDMAAYRSIPGTVVCSPRNELELKDLMFTALRRAEGPFIIRYPRGMGEGTAWRDAAFSEVPVGKAEVLRKGSGVAVIGIGPVVNRALEAVDLLRKASNPALPEEPQQEGIHPRPTENSGRCCPEEPQQEGIHPRPTQNFGRCCPGMDASCCEGLSVGVYDFKFLKPLDTDMLDRIAAEYEAVLTVEEGCLYGGLYGAVTEYYASKGVSIRVKGKGIPDRFVPHARQTEQRAACGLDAKSIADAISMLLR